MKQIYPKIISYRAFLLIITLCVIQQLPAKAQQKQLVGADNCKVLNAWLLLGDSKEARLDGQTLYQPELLVQFYALQNCKPAWYDERTKTARIDTFLNVMHEAEMKKDNHIYYLDYTYNEIKAFYLPLGLFNFDELYKIDVLLTDAALNYGLQLAFEKQGDEEIGGEQSSLILLKQLDMALKNNRLTEFIRNLRENGLTAADAPLSGTDLQKARIALDKALSEAEKGTLKDTMPAQTFTVSDSALYKTLQQKGEIRIRNERLTTQTIANGFYKKRNYAPAWHNGTSPIPVARQVAEAITQAPADGLYVGDYHQKAIDQLLKQSTWDAAALNDLDLLLTDAALLFAQHLRLGRLNPRQLTLQWDVRQGSADFEKELETALNNGQIAPFFDQMRPKQAQYKYLKNALERYRKYAGNNSDGWAYQAAPAEALKLDAKGEAVRKLRQRLAAEGYPKLIKGEKIDTIVKNIDQDNTVNISEIIGFEGDKAIIVKHSAGTAVNEIVFDSTLLKAVKTYQRLHSMGADGAAGAKTLENMNITAKDRLGQIQMALEMWRWLPADLGNRYILVNIPAYMMYVYENKDKIALQKKVCVGKVEHKTPIFSDKMEYLELNPYWTVPQTIAKNEVLPALKREGTNYLRRNNMKALSGGSPINANTVKWWTLSKKLPALYF